MVSRSFEAHREIARLVGNDVIRKLYFGWWDMKSLAFRISLYPPDSPVRPSLAIDSMAEVKALLERKRADVFWSPPLPADEVIERAQAG